MKRFRISLALWALGGLALGTAWGWRRGASLSQTAPWMPPARASGPTLARLAPATSAAGSSAKGSLAQIERIAAASRQELLALTKEMLAGGADFHVLNFLWARWVEVDPEGGYQALLAGEFTTEDRMNHVWNYLGQWSAVDPDAAVSRAVALPLPRDRNVSLSRISHELANRPADFFRLLPELKKGDDWAFVTETAARHLASSDPAAAIKLFENSERVVGMDNLALAKGFAAGWAKTDPAAAADYFRHQEGEVRAEGLTVVARRMVQSDPALAAAMVVESGKKGAVVEVAGALAETDPDAALDWLAAHFPDESAKTRTKIAKAAIPRKAAEAVAFMARHPDEIFGRDGLNAADRLTWGVDSPQVGLQAAEAVPDPAVRAKIEKAMLELLATREPQEALGMVGRLSADPTAARPVIRAAVETWAKADISAASGWLSGQPPGEDRDEGIYGLLVTATALEPDSALRWAAALSDADKRSRQIVTILRRARQTGGDQIDAALKNLPLSAQDRENVKQLFDQPRPVK